MNRPIALITGASAGIGAEFARQLSASGHDLVLVARREDRLRALADELATACEIIAADLGSEAGVDAVAARIADGAPLALLVNNAGFAARGKVGELDEARLGEMLQLNVITLARLSHAAMKRMPADGAGAIVNVASGTAFLQMPGNAGYGASKSFVVAFTRHLRAEAKGSGVKIQLLVPGVVATDFHAIAKASLDRFPPSAVMSARDLVAASLDGLDRDEGECFPSVEEMGLWQAYVAAEAALAATVSRDRPASRYRAGDADA